MRLGAFMIVIASLLIGMAFVVNDNAIAGDEQVAAGKVAAEERPFFDPFLANNEALDEFFFERDVLGIIEGDFEDNPLFKQDNRNAFERPEDFRADE